MGGTPLGVAFPDLYILAGTKGALAAYLLVNSGGSDAWNPKFERYFND